MTIPNRYLIVEDAKAHQLHLRQEAERHNIRRSASAGRRGWQHQARRRFGQALIAVGEWLYADARKPARSPAPSATHLDPV